MTEQRGGLAVRAFADRAALETWLIEQPANAPGIWLKLAKKAAAIPSVSRAEAIDAALCHGWIDGQLDKYDDAYWLVRFTPRRPRSKWSEVNRARALELIASGRMQAGGQAEIATAQAEGRWDAAYAPASTAAVPDDLQAALDASPRAAAFFATLTGANRYAVLYRIATVKRAETRVRKIAEAVAMLERGDTAYPGKAT